MSTHKNHKDDYYSSKMDTPLSAYWVKFFKNAGFPTEVATRHAVIFSNNRIKPDMLPELDKPSLKEMGIALMGDMIAILRYAKKVVEETTCKNFLVDSEINLENNVNTPPTKPLVKKIATKPAAIKSSVITKPKVQSAGKIITTKVSSNLEPKPTLTIKKKVIQRSSSPSRMYSDYIENNEKQKPKILKRKFTECDDNSDEDQWQSRDVDKRLKPIDDIKYNVIMPKRTATIGTKKIIKTTVDPKKTVFHRLGDSIVSSTTNSLDSSPTFNITGLGKNYNRNSSVFRRLGDKDANQKQTIKNLKIIKNGNSKTATQGILKIRTPLLGTKVYTPKQIVSTSSSMVSSSKSHGTMRADQEQNKRSVADSVKKFIKTKNDQQYNNYSVIKSNTKINIPMNKLASERPSSLPAKSRLGSSKQVTFKRVPTITHIRKPGVFSRLGAV